MIFSTKLEGKFKKGSILIEDGEYIGTIIKLYKNNKAVIDGKITNSSFFDDRKIKVIQNEDLNDKITLSRSEFKEFLDSVDTDQYSKQSLRIYKFLENLQLEFRKKSCTCKTSINCTVEEKTPGEWVNYCWKCKSVRTC